MLGLEKPGVKRSENKKPWNPIVNFKGLQGLWKPGSSGNKNGNRSVVPLRRLIKQMSEDGEVLVEFCMRIVLGQDLRLAPDWEPLESTRHGSRSRMEVLQEMLKQYPEPPVITMDDRRWAVQLLFAYGWGLPARQGDLPGEKSEEENDLGQRTMAAMHAFAPQSPEEQERLTRVLELIEGPDGTYKAADPAPPPAT